MKRVISAILGVILIGIVIFLGIKTEDGNIYIILFGLSSALVAPIGISALGYSIRKEDKTLKKLAMVPEIDNLIERAETEQGKIKRLKREKNELLNYIRNDTKRIALVERKKILESDIRRLWEEYENVNSELAEIEGEKPDISQMSNEIRKLCKDHTELNVTAWGESYTIRGIYDLYSLPAEIIANMMNKMIIYTIDAIQNLINNIINK